MVEGIPGPDHLKVGIENQDHVSQDIDRTRALHVSQNLFNASEHQDFAIWKQAGFVVKTSNLPFSHRHELFVHSSRVGGANGHTDKVELAKTWAD